MQNTGPSSVSKPPVVGPVDARPDEVGRDEVRRELDPLERAAEHRGRRLDRQRLREARHALDQQVAAGDEADEHALEHLVLAGDDALDLDERLLEAARAPRSALAPRRGRGWSGAAAMGSLSGADMCTLLASTTVAERPRAARPSPMVDGSHDERCCGVVLTPAIRARLQRAHAGGVDQPRIPAAESCSSMSPRGLPRHAGARRSSARSVRAWLDESLPDELKGHRGGAARFDGPEVRAWSRALYDGGWVGIAWPEEFGGRGLAPRFQAIYLEEEARAEAPPHVGVIGLGMAGPTIISPRHRGAEGAVPRRRSSRPTRSGARGSPSPAPAPTSPASAPPRASTATASCSTARRSGRRTPTSRTTASCSRAPTPARERHAGLTYLIVDMHAPGRRGAAADPDHRRRRVQRDLPERRRGAARERHRRDRRRLGRGDDDAPPRARHARVRARRAARGAGREAARARARPRRDAGAARRDRAGVDRAPGAPRSRRTARSRALERTGIPGPEGSILKLQWSEANQRVTSSRSTCSARTRSSSRRTRPTAATGRCSSSAAAATRSRRGRRRSSATSSPSACSACRGRGSAPRRPVCLHRRSQDELRAQARSFLEVDTPSRPGAQLAELGWTGGLVAEEHGGAGLGFLEEAVLHEEARARAAPRPALVDVVPAAVPARPRPGRRRGRRGELDARARPARPRPRHGDERRDRRRRHDLGARRRRARGARDERRVAPARRRLRRRGGPRALLVGGPPRAPHPVARDPRARGRRRRVEGARARGRVRRRRASSSAAASAPTRPSRTRSRARTRELELARSLAWWAAWCVAEDDAESAGRGRRRRRRRPPRRPSRPASARSRRTAGSASPGSTCCTGSTSARSGSSPGRRHRRSSAPRSRVTCSTA